MSGSGVGGALVVGAGSIGSRHARNLRALGVSLTAVVDSDIKAAQRLAAEVDSRGFSSLDEAISFGVPELAVVCTPPLFHVPQCIRLLENGAHVLVEKPLSHSSAEIPALAEAARAAGRLVQVGYNLRFHPGLRLVKRMIEGGELGRILWSRFEVGQYLPDWRPGRDYRQGYTARVDLGGGILLDASHEIDYACWLLGEVSELTCMIGRSGTLEMETEDLATLLIRFTSGAQADIHMDCLQRTYARECKIVGENGTLIWDYTANEVRSKWASDSEWHSQEYMFQANDMYLAELSHFIHCIESGNPPETGIEDGLRVLRIVEAAKMGGNLRQLVI